MFTPKYFYAVLLLLAVNFSAVFAQFTISVPNLEVTIGQRFTVSWTSSNDSNEPQDVDICLNTDTDFIPIGSISRNNAVSGSVDIVLDDTIFPTTYTLGIRFPGCSFLLAEEFDDFVVDSPSRGVFPRALTSRISRAHLG